MEVNNKGGCGFSVVEIVLILVDRVMNVELVLKRREVGEEDDEDLLYCKVLYGVWK